MDYQSLFGKIKQELERGGRRGLAGKRADAAGPGRETSKDLLQTRIYMAENKKVGNSNFPTFALLKHPRIYFVEQKQNLLTKKKKVFVSQTFFPLCAVAIPLGVINA